MLSSRRILSALIVAGSVSGVGGVAFALANSVSTTPAPAFVSRLAPDGPGDSGANATPTTNSSGPSTGSIGHDDPATHDVGDDHGGTTGSTTVTTARHEGGDDDPATHDVGDDHGAATGSTTNSTTVTTSGSGRDDSGSGSGRGRGGSGGSGSDG